ncbi:MAG: phospholipase D-like domain-containing protein [Ignavibacteria bacterium]|nr:phospholipase D-like domain-containing protein [Ignavibacteria bacterium]
MRNRNENNGIELTVLTGTYAALLSFRITDSEKVDREDFLGFEVKRDDITENESYPLRGFKHFTETATMFDSSQSFPTDRHPVQSFFWEDFTVKPAHDYVYHIIPVYGTPKNLNYGGEVSVEVKSEIAEGEEHSVFFNRGVAGSLAYARKFKNIRPDKMPEKMKAEARIWLSRGLEEALLGFIDKAIKNKYGLRIAFYEFTYPPVIQKLHEAISKGCDVQIVYDSRKEKADNDKAIKNYGLERTITKAGKKIDVLTRRTKNPQVPSHNKFMILMDGETPLEVWTGSTNITGKGILGQCNVGHMVSDKKTAQKYLSYWESLHKDPEVKSFKNAVAEIQDDIDSPEKFEDDITVFFSPRNKKTILKTYSKFIEEAEEMVCGIFPFSFNKDIKASLGKKTNHLKYILVDKIGNAKGIEKKDGNTVIVNGEYFQKPMFDWLQEINSGFLLNEKPNSVFGTNYVHNKVLLVDPFSKSPVIISGSANFSDASVSSNDENTMVIKSGKDLRRICDIYFTEFYRIFHHFFVRQATKEINKGKTAAPDDKNNPLHLKTDNSWVSKFSEDGVKVKMQELIKNMPLDY